MANRENMELVVHLSISFLCLFTAFGSLQNIVSEAYALNNYGSLGFYTLAVIYISLSVWSWFSTSIISKFGPLKSMQIGSLFYFIWALWGILPVTLDNSETSKIIVWTTMIISSAMLGFGASILWVGQGKYIADWSGSDNNGYYTGLFFSIFMISQIIGNLISAFILYLFSQIIFFIIMSCFTLFGVLSFLFLKSPIHKLKHKEIVNINENETKDSIQLKDSKDKMFDEDSKRIKTDESNFFSTIVLFFSIKMMKVNSLIIVWGIVLAIQSGLLVTLISNSIPNSNEKLSKSLLWMIIFGISGVCGSYSFGALIEKTNNKTGVVISFVLTLLSVIFIIYSLSLKSYTVYWFVSAMFLGLSDSALSTIASSIWGFEFIDKDHMTGKIEPFAIRSFLKSISTAIFIVIESKIKDHNQLDLQIQYFVTIGVLSSILFGYTLTLDFRIEKIPEKNQ